MSAERPIPQRLVDAFRNAVVAADGWRQGEDEMSLRFAGKSYTIREIADFAAQYSDLMPDDTDWLIRKLAASMHRQVPVNKTFAKGGKCLRAIYDEIARQKKQRR